MFSKTLFLAVASVLCGFERVAEIESVIFLYLTKDIVFN